MAFSDPQHNIEQLGVSEGMKAVDFGSGSGFYTLALARVVGVEGKVYAVDVQQELLSKVKDAGIQAGLDNLEVVWADLEKFGSTRLADDSIDVGVISNILFQLEDKETLLREALRVLKPTGRVLVVDWSDSFGGMGPRGEDIVSETVAKKLVEAAGFSIEKSILAGDHHYGFVARKPNRK